MYMLMYIFCVVVVSFCKAFSHLKLNQVMYFMLDGKLVTSYFKITYISDGRYTAFSENLLLGKMYGSITSNLVI